MRPVPIPDGCEDDNWHRQVIAPPPGHDPFRSTIGTLEALVGFVEVDGSNGIAIRTRWVIEGDDCDRIAACLMAGEEPTLELVVYANQMVPVDILVVGPS